MKVTYQQTKHVSIFNVEGDIDANLKDEIFSELHEICHGDSMFYLREYGGKIRKIEFETDDEYYVDEEFASRHAEEISEVLTRFVKEHRELTS
jgi:hypothetical protein